MVRYRKTKYKRRPRSSKLEGHFATKFLGPTGTRFTRQHKLGSKYFDFCIPSLKILIEVDGDFWHGNTATGYGSPSKRIHESRKNDAFKNGLAKAYGYKLLRFWESDIRKNPIIVKTELRKAFNQGDK